ncbi:MULTISPECIES: hypothetical protein [unclassified Streptomyces]|uniref:hypothetical protein n=1 Tax=unclassified Streptomyces TaxID=2593676 RepID=UPI002DDA5859|nr:hypothetical protein [Streptomyces sp. NBC_01750]
MSPRANRSASSCSGEGPACHRHALAGRPLWLFSSGPLDPSALERDFPAVRGVRQVERRLGALEHVTFGGRPADGARGRIARVILEEDGDDCRD